MPTKPADRTSSVARPPSDFESQLQGLVFEATPLHLVPAAVADRSTADPATTDPATATPAQPKDPRDTRRCATVLLRWLDADLMVLLESTTTTDGDQSVTESRQLAYDEARAVLADPRGWPAQTSPADGVHLLQSGERALDVDDDAWWSAARGGDHLSR